MSTYLGLQPVLPPPARLARVASVALLALWAQAAPPLWAQPSAPIRDVVSPSAQSTAVAPSPAPVGLMPLVGQNFTYEVKAGETLYTLGLRYKLAIEHLMWANGLAGMAVKPGTRLLIPAAHVLPATLEDGLVVNLPERGMYLFKNHQPIAFYPCAIGMGGRFATPLGDAKVVNRQVDPTWSPPEWSEIKKPVPPGPGNPLGDRWIGLSMDGVGLHGTNQPMSIGQNASHGCMRMYPAVIHQLFEQVHLGMPVRIIYEPIKVGLSPVDHKVYVQIYADVYNRVPNMFERLRERLQGTGLADLVDDARLEALLADKSALPQRLLGEDIVLKVNGRKVSTALAPFLRGGQVWTSSDFLRAVGARVRFDTSSKQLTVSRDGQEATFPLHDSTAASHEPVASDLAARLWNGRSVLPLKPVLTALNLDCKWIAASRTLQVRCPVIDPLH
jgi:L,D-transpeptidase ErfK/SrfK